MKTKPALTLAATMMPDFSNGVTRSARIVTGNHPALRTVCEPVKQGESLAFISEMRMALRESENGVGLAAPQIGVTKRVILLRPNRKLGIEVLINPVITWASNDLVDGREGCLSYPGVTAMILRFRSVKVNYVSEKWQAKERLFTNFDARIVQHECDHLDGICRVGDVWRAGK